MSTDATPGPWDGRGLPPVAAARIRRAAGSDVATSLLSAPAAAALGAVGLQPIGEAMGCVVEQIGWQGYGGCGVNPGFGFGATWGGDVNARTVSAGSSRWVAFAPYVEAIRRGYATALDRLLQEATALGADGVVGIDLTVSHLGNNAREFMALGTAVRAAGPARPRRPFTTELSGTDVAKLLPRGWVPAALVVAVEVAIRHDDWNTRNQAMSWSNTEVAGYTELVQHARRAVRSDLGKQVRRLGADGLVASELGLRISEIEPAEQHRDHVAEAIMIGTAIAHFDHRPHDHHADDHGQVRPRPGAPSGAPVPILSLADLSRTRRNHP